MPLHAAALGQVGADGRMHPRGVDHQICPENAELTVPADKEPRRLPTVEDGAGDLRLKAEFYARILRTVDQMADQDLAVDIEHRVAGRGIGFQLHGLRGVPVPRLDIGREGVLRPRDAAEIEGLRQHAVVPVVAERFPRARLDHGHVVPVLRQTDRSGKAPVPGAGNGDFKHLRSLLSLFSFFFPANTPACPAGRRRRRGHRPAYCPRPHP